MHRREADDDRERDKNSAGDRAENGADSFTHRDASDDATGPHTTRRVWRCQGRASVIRRTASSISRSDKLAYPNTRPRGPVEWRA